MKKHLLRLASVALFLSACKKNKDDVPSPPLPAAKKLVKMVVKEGSLTTTRTFAYDAAGRLAVFQQTVADGGIPTLQRGLRIGRNAAGLIEKVRYTENSVDSATLIVTSSGERYTGADKLFSNNTGSRITFAYDAEGRIATNREHNNASPGSQADEYDSFAYQNGNMVVTKYYVINNGAPVVYRTWAFEYDDKKSPLTGGNDWIVLATLYYDYSQWSSVHNVTKATTSFSATYTYTYNDQGLPTGFTSSQPSATGTYFYE